MKRYAVVYLDSMNRLDVCETWAHDGELAEEESVVLELAKANGWRWFRVIEIAQ